MEVSATEDSTYHSSPSHGITQPSLLQACCSCTFTTVAEVGEEHWAISDVFPSLVAGQHHVMQFVLYSLPGVLPQRLIFQPAFLFFHLPLLPAHSHSQNNPSSQF